MAAAPCARLDDESGAWDDGDLEIGTSSHHAVVEPAAEREMILATPQALAGARAAALHEQPQHDDEQNASDDANDGC
jgi:hypothetical protein